MFAHPSPRTVRRSKGRPASTPFRPRLEFLEDRCLLNAGALDTTFGTGGIVRTDIKVAGLSQDDLAGAMTLQFGNLPVVAGVSFNPNTPTPVVSVAVTRYLDHGRLDPSFGSGGISLTASPAGSIFGEITGVAAQDDGTVLVAGDFITSTQVGFLERLDSFGNLDRGFGTHGQVVFSPVSTGVSNTAGLVVANGKIYVASTITNGSTFNGDFAVTRFKSNGLLDTDYGNGGTAVADFGTASASATGIALTPGGKVVVTGSLANSSTDIGLAQFTTAGALDDGFGGGTGEFQFGLTANPSTDFANALTITTGGKILVAGETFANTANGDFFLASINANGTLDTSFDPPGAFAPGKVVTDFGNNIDNGTSVVIDLAGHIVVGGLTAPNVTNTPFGIGLARYNADGSPDTTFGTGGEVITSFTGQALSTNVKLAIDSSNKIVAAASIAANPPTGLPPFDDFLVARYFGSDGPTRLSPAAALGAADAAQGAAYDQPQKSILLSNDGGYVRTGAPITGDLSRGGEANPSILDNLFSMLGLRRTKNVVGDALFDTLLGI